MTTAEGAFSYEKFQAAVTRTLRKNPDQGLAYAFAVNAVVWSLAIRRGVVEEKDVLAVFDEWTKRANTAFVMADDVLDGLAQAANAVKDGEVPITTFTVDDPAQLYPPSRP